MGFEVKDRLHGCIAAETVYHDSCMCFSQFMLNKQLDAATTKISRGRPKDQTMEWLDHLEAGLELNTIAELQAKMVEFSGEGDHEVYTTICQIYGNGFNRKY